MYQETDQFDYPFDERLIAPVPLKQRTQSRLFVYHRETGERHHDRFGSIINWFRPNDLLVVNNTRVFPARLQARKENMGPFAANGEREGCGAVELLLIRPADHAGTASLCWEALVKGKFSDWLTLRGGGRARLAEDMGQGRKKIFFELPACDDLQTYLEKWGEVPVPPYILRRRKVVLQGEDPLPTAEMLDPNDIDRYQTVYARQIGSIAAPTAGLHFSRRLMTAIKKQGTRMVTVTLHIGPDTFRPISAGRLAEHKMHGERFEIPEKTVYAFAETRRLGGRIIAVGTSVMRALESASDGKNGVSKGSGETDLFITCLLYTSPSPRD